MNPLPPQAYTKETLVKAYQWLQHQSDNIKEMATSPDILVSLFLKAKLQGDSALERPSIQNFKSELRNLAGMIGEFEVVETGPAPNGPLHMPPLPASAPTPIAPHSQSHPSSPPPTTAMGPQASVASTAPTTAPHPNMAPQRRPMPELDTRSWLMIQEVKTQLNLSSDQEALRVLISVGHSKVKALMCE